MKPKLIFIFFLLAMLKAPLLVCAQTSNERQTFRQYLTELRNNPLNDDLRKNIIQLSLKIYPPVLTPKEYPIYLANAKKEIGTGISSSNCYRAISELNRAIEAAPWMPEAYFNIAMLYEEYAGIEKDINNLQKAISNYNYFLLTKPDAGKTKQTKEKIKDLQALYDGYNKIDQKKLAINSGWRKEFEAALIDGASSSSIFKGASTHISLRLGVNFPAIIPMIVNNNAERYTTSKNYIGAGVYAGLEIWPLYGKNVGIGGYADGSYGSGGVILDVAKTVNYNYGLNAFLGKREIKLILNYAITKTNFSFPSKLAKEWDKPTSQLELGSKRYGAGVRFNFKKERSDLNLMLLLEKLDYLPADQKSIQIFRIGYNKSGKSFIQLDITPNYPVVGNKKYSVDNQYKDNGWYVNFSVAHSFDFFGHRFRNQNW